MKLDNVYNKIEGDYVFGWLKKSQELHRLVKDFTFGARVTYEFRKCLGLSLLLMKI